MDPGRNSLLRMIYASMFGAATAVGAYLVIPLAPVPITLQTFFLNLASALLGGSLGALSQVVYLLLGILGLPVFAGGKAGLGVLLGPTGGYLIGFILSALLVGKIVALRSKPGVLWMILAMTLGLLVIDFCGTLQLSLVAKLSYKKALVLGVLPFLPGDFLKIIAAALVASKVRERFLNGVEE